MDENKVTQYDDDIIIDLKDLLQDAAAYIRRFYRLLFVLLCIFAVGGGLLKVLSYQPMYQSSAMFTVLLKDGNKESSYEYTYTTAAENQLEKVFDGIASSRVYREYIRTQLGENSLNETIEISSAGTNQFRLTVRGTDKEHTKVTADMALACFADSAAYAVGEMSLNISQEPEIANAPYNGRGIKKGIIYGAVLAAALAGVGMVIYVLKRIEYVHKDSDLKERLHMRSFGKINAAHPDTVKSAALRILKQLETQKKKVILVAGEIPEKEQAAALLVLARMLAGNQRKVLLADCNLKVPQYSGLTADMDLLSSMLSGKKRWEDCIRSVETHKIDFIGNMEPEAKYAGLISSNLLDSFIKEAKMQYDYILLAAPLDDQMSASARLAENADGVLWMTGNGYGSRKAICRKITKLIAGGAELMGGIFVENTADDLKVKKIKKYKKNS